MWKKKEKNWQTSKFPEEVLLIYSFIGSGLNAAPAFLFNHLWVIKAFPQPSNINSTKFLIKTHYIKW